MLMMLMISKWFGVGLFWIYFGVFVYLPLFFSGGGDTHPTSARQFIQDQGIYPQHKFGKVLLAIILDSRLNGRLVLLS